MTIRPGAVWVAVGAAFGAVILAVWLTLAGRPVPPSENPLPDASEPGTIDPLDPPEPPVSNPPPSPAPARPDQTAGRGSGSLAGEGVASIFPPGRATRPPAARGAGTPPAPVPPPPPPADIRDRFADVDAALGDLVRGHVAFNTPDRMAFQERRTVTLLASPQMDAASLSEELRDRIGSGQPIQLEALQVAPLMEAQLQGAPAFGVTALTPARQPVSRAMPTEWRWDVQAFQAGVQTLHLTMNAVVTIDGERFPRSLGVLNREIVVEISAGQQLGHFLTRNWQWLAGTIVVPLVVWFWSTRRSRRRSETGEERGSG